MRERAPTLLYVVAAIALCVASTVAVRQVRANADARVHAAQRAAQEAMRGEQLAIDELEHTIGRLADAVAATDDAVERERLSSELLLARRRYKELTKHWRTTACPRPIHSPVN